MPSPRTVSVDARELEQAVNLLRGAARDVAQHAVEVTQGIPVMSPGLEAELQLELHSIRAEMEHLARELFVDAAVQQARLVEFGKADGVSAMDVLRTLAGDINSAPGGVGFGAPIENLPAMLDLVPAVATALGAGGRTGADFWEATKRHNPVSDLIGGTTGMGINASADFGEPWRSLGLTLGADRYVKNSDALGEDAPRLSTAQYGSFNTAHRQGGWALGAQASAGAHFTFSTIPRTEGMLGKFHNMNLNLGTIADFSANVAWDDAGHWAVSPGLGLGIGLSLSSYDTDTIRTENR